MERPPELFFFSFFLLVLGVYGVMYGIWSSPGMGEGVLRRVFELGFAFVHSTRI